MRLHIYKYQGAGNDFIILDNRNNKLNLNPNHIKYLCNRRFGIGADGLMLLEKSNNYNFSMKYYNSNGYEGSMCGNGGRCIIAFAARLGINEFEFEATDGYHTANILEFTPQRCLVKLKMIDIKSYNNYSDNAFFLNTGSPHYVEFIKGLDKYPVDEKGKYWRYNKDFEGGTNVNFVELISETDFKIRTYERGVEAETLACGTGVTASAIATFLYTGKALSDSDNTKNHSYDIQTLGNKLSVDFKYNSKENSFTDVFLTGPATFVFECNIDLD